MAKAKKGAKKFQSEGKGAPARTGKSFGGSAQARKGALKIKKSKQERAAKVLSKGG